MFHHIEIVNESQIQNPLYTIVFTKYCPKTHITYHVIQKQTTGKVIAYATVHDSYQIERLLQQSPLTFSEAQKYIPEYYFFPFNYGI